MDRRFMMTRKSRPRFFEQRSMLVIYLTSHITRPQAWAQDLVISEVHCSLRNFCISCKEYSKVMTSEGLLVKLPQWLFAFKSETCSNALLTFFFVRMRTASW